MIQASNERMMPVNSPVKKIRTVDLVYIAMFAALMAICAWISIPSAVPFTLQTFGVFLAVGMLGGKRGLLAICVYILLGAVGLPVFAGFKGGLSALIGTTGGYIVGFIAMAAVYWLITGRISDSRPARVIAMIAGLLVCYLFGTAWFVVVYTAKTGAVGWLTALSWCVFPYIVPDLVKLALALLLSDRLARFLR